MQHRLRLTSWINLQPRSLVLQIGIVATEIFVSITNVVLPNVGVIASVITGKNVTMDVVNVTLGRTRVAKTATVSARVSAVTVTAKSGS